MTIRRDVAVRLGYSDDAETEPIVTVPDGMDAMSYAFVARWVKRMRVCELTDIDGIIDRIVPAFAPDLPIVRQKLRDALTEK